MLFLIIHSSSCHTQIQNSVLGSYVSFSSSNSLIRSNMSDLIWPKASLSALLHESRAWRCLRQRCQGWWAHTTRM